MALIEAFSTVLAAAGSVAAIGFLAKLFANSIASAAIKRYELVNAQALEEQKLTHQKELEDIKSQLVKLQKEHEIVFSNLYVKREKVVINLYKLMSELALLAEHKRKDSSIEIDTKCRALIDYFELNRLYFPRDIAGEINNVINTVFYLSNDPEHEKYEQLVFQLKIQVYDQMESAFRELLKIEDYR
ncbi:hypothetical protein MA615_004164 [Vibrio vulnificus]|uniref:Uncharacterized protein n=1 Tax=Vibrio ordalii FS-238 TaxID=617133 RepID=A0A853R8K5_9VIBR|nr:MULTISPECIES: hypothetical protein [Vibrio]EHH1047326.1 hypothetical protein [Vibrio parahaemolyticus]EHU4930420.1 hypothetical protein [Vibrio vulnificus]EJL6474377.1 hypothetical protein [Vibrio cholerae]EHH2456342.1 hypothetical protein [Vibrio parahaemolyticus]EHZ2493370.1 hypothetical protein [Vibrio parahaemolyticus]